MALYIENGRQVSGPEIEQRIRDKLTMAGRARAKARAEREDRRAERAKLVAERKRAWEAEADRRDAIQRAAKVEADAKGLHVQLAPIPFDPPEDYRPLPPPEPQRPMPVSPEKEQNYRQMIAGPHADEEQGKPATVVEPIAGLSPGVLDDMLNGEDGS
jgi:hypothetical protein